MSCPLPFRGLAALIGVTLVCGASPAAAIVTDNLDVGLDVRWRPETDRKIYAAGVSVTAPGRSFGNVQLLRSRLNVGIKVKSGSRIFIQVQDSRVLGQTPAATLLNDTNLGIHQAFLEIANFFHPKLSWQAGRFHMNYGNQRLIGAVQWFNTGRSFDGARFSVKTDAFVGDLFLAKTFEQITTRDEDAEFIGAYARFPKAGSDLFVVYNHDAGQIPILEALGVTGDIGGLRRTTVGGYSALPFANKTLDYVVNLAYQFGDNIPVLVTDPDSGDSTTVNPSISAYLITAELAWNTANQGNRLALGVDFASGDDPSTEDFESFNNLFYTGHKFRGFMDQFLPSNIEGLIDVYLADRVKALKKWTFLGAVHYFQTHRDYETFDSRKTDSDPPVLSKNLGWELDLKVNTTVLEDAQLGFGGAVFIPDKAWQGGDADPQGWGYVTLRMQLQ